MMTFILALSAISSVAFSAEATVSDKFAQVRGFKVEISGSSGKAVDTSWESLSAWDPTTEFETGTNRRGFFRPRGALRHYGKLTLSMGNTTNDELLGHTIYLNNCKPNGCNLRVNITPAHEVDGRLVARESYRFSNCTIDDYKMSENSETSSITLSCELSGLENQQFSTLRTELKTKHDTVKNSIQNMR